MSRIAFQRAFQELDDGELDDLIASAERFTFPAGTRILREGEDNARIFVVLEGAIRVVHFEREGAEKKIADPLGPGDAFGEMSFIDEMGASATLIADSDVVAKAAGKDLVAALAARHPGFMERFYLSLLYTVIRRLRRLDAAFLMRGK
ncbi:cyclic nucleotide-binding domain-containing protein [Magnetospirillum sp. UT-4]|uniref:cyclic nucleotide-binding domain-containing protein n=1 Tax=Magnetospirillum sp. UT-4 TaxID=2681467 RepID=UPI00137E5CA5|nr:cyclic nucleotide-binding domain-containing protein [Magnetospirillum sp. UT-4]CAA7620331.1 hypothetical protein MTBUT4_350030 [Magnetospirillum sp. UT-4]